MNDETKITVSFKNNVGGEAKLEKYRKTLLDINSVLNGLNTGAAKQIETSAANTKSIATNVSKMSKQTDVAFNYTTVRAFARAIHNLSTTIGTYVNKSATYLENMNLLDVAYQNNTTSATKFVNKLSEMYGLDESWGYRTVGIFKQLANAMGIAAEKGNQVSETLAQFAIDVSSLYNIETNDAVQILSSALAGQTKPARRLGADITMSTLQTTLDQAGIDKQIGNLSYAEKRLVIIASLLTQVSEANNDWGRTIESVANQTRIMHEQWERLTRTFGNMLLPLVKRILPYVNGILMALTEIFSVIASLLGYDEDDFDFFGTADIDLDDYTGGMDDLTKSTDKATTATNNLKKAQMGLRSFDKLNNITTPSTSGTGGVGGGSIGGGAGGIGADIWSMAKKAMDDYNSKLSEVQMKATKIRDQIMDWLGFTKIIDEETGKVSFKFDHITGGTVLGALAVGGVIFKGVYSIYNILKSLNLLKFPILSTLTKFLGGTSLGANAANIKGGLSLILKDGSKLGTVLTKNIIPSLSNMASTLAPIAAIVVSILAYVEAFKKEKVQDQLERVSFRFKELKRNLDPIMPVLSKFVGFIKDAVLPLGRIATAFGAIFKVLTELAALNISNFLSGVENLLDLINAILQGDFRGAFDALISGFEDLFQNFIDFWDGVSGKEKDSLDKSTKAMTDYQEHYRKTWEEQEKYVNNAIMEEEAGTQALIEILGGLINTNGKVSDSNKMKADIIANELSKATGQQIKLDGDQITVNGKVVKSQKELVKQMDILIARQKVKILLQADEEKYVAALKQQNKLNSEAERLQKLYTDSLSDTSEQGQAVSKMYYAMWKDAEKQASENTNTVNNYQALMEGQYMTSKDNIEKLTKDYLNGSAITAEQSAKDAATAVGKAMDVIMGDVRSKTTTEINNMKTDLAKKKLNVNIAASITTAQNNLLNVAGNIGKALATKFPKLAGLFGLAANGGIFKNGKWQPITNYATGGLPPVGQMFVARERGPELVGTINGSTAVMNNNQIVSSVASGVYQAVRSAMGSNNNGNQVYNIYLDKNNKIATYTLEQLQQMATTNGKPIRIGG